MPSFKEAFATAVKKGYTIDRRGRVVSRGGRVRKLRVRAVSGTLYSYFTVRVGRNGNASNISIPVHRFGGYLKFGRRIFGKHVRHRNNRSLDNRLANLDLGTQSQNELDKPRHVRVRNAKKAARARWRRSKDKA